MAKQYTITGIPDDEVEIIMQGFKDQKATNVTKKPENGTWTVTAIVPDKETGE